jgi:glyoxylase-like metal-dependent hydrolase (beta-lactamase superfamily II)
VTFEDHYVLEVGGEELHLAYHGPNTTPDNIFIFAPRHQTLMVVDVLFPGWVPFKGLAIAQDIPGWISAQSIALDYPWTTLVGGHLGRLGSRPDASTQIQYVADLMDSTRAAIAAVDPTPFFQAYEPNAWAVFKGYLDAVSSKAADPVIAKYNGVLAAADVYTFLNAATMLDSLRSDAGDLGPFGDHP